MQKKLLSGWMVLHLLFIVIVNILGAYTAYSDFHNLPKTNHLATQLTEFVNTPACKYYGRWTGAETGYGFFGINVRSNGLLIGECNGRELSPEFISNETSLRFFTMANTITEDLVKSGKYADSSDNILNVPIIKQFKDLVIKNIAITLFQKYNCTDSSVTISYNLLNFPTLEEVRNGAPKKYSLHKLYSVTFTLNNHRNSLP